MNTSTDKPHPLDVQRFKLQAQIAVAETTRAISVALLDGMLKVPIDPNTSKFNKVSASATLRMLRQIAEAELSSVVVALNDLHNRAGDERFRATECSQDDIQNADYEITGEAVAWMSKLGEVGSHLVKGLEWLQKLSPQALPFFQRRVIDAMQNIQDPGILA
jgi:hypothetical protein